MLGFDGLDQFDAIGAAQGDIDGDQVGRKASDAIEGGGGIVGLAADLHVGFGVDEIGDAVAEEGVIVHDEDAILFLGGGVRGRLVAGWHGLVCGGLGFHFRGRRQRISAPCGRR